MINTPFHECLHALSLGQPPDWTKWKALSTREQSLLFDAMIACNDVDTIVQHMDHVGQTLHSMYVNPYYFFPKDMTEQQWQTIKDLDEKKASQVSTVFLELTVQSAVNHDLPNMLTWIRQSKECSRMAYYLRDAVRDCGAKKHVATLIKAVEILQELGMTIKQLQQQSPEAGMIWQRHVLAQQISQDQKSMTSKRM